jgi:hypothetical protein
VIGSEHRQHGTPGRAVSDENEPAQSDRHSTRHGASAVRVFETHGATLLNHPLFGHTGERHVRVGGTDAEAGSDRLLGEGRQGRGGRGG